MDRGCEGDGVEFVRVVGAVIEGDGVEFVRVVGAVGPPCSSHARSNADRSRCPCSVTS